MAGYSFRSVSRHSKVNCVPFPGPPSGSPSVEKRLGVLIRYYGVEYLCCGSNSERANGYAPHDAFLLILGRTSTSSRARTESPGYTAMEGRNIRV